MKKLSFRDDVLPLKNRLFRLALRITLDRAEAEDIVQDVMLRVWNRRAELENVNSIEAFCMAVCRNLSLDRSRLKAASNVGMAEAGIPEATAPAPDTLMIRDERVANVMRLIDRLPMPQRVAIQLRDIEGKSYREISEITGQSEEQVKVNIFRARQSIRKQIENLENYGL